MANNIFELMNARESAFRKAKRTKTKADWTAAKDARNVLSRSIIKSNRDYVAETITKYKTNHKRLWKQIKEHLPDSKTLPQRLQIYQMTISQTLANHLQLKYLIMDPTISSQLYVRKYSRKSQIRHLKKYMIS